MVESVDTKDLKSFGYCSCAGSSPASSTEFFRHNAEVAQLVEHNLAKVRVAGSSPVFRSLPKGLVILRNSGAFYFMYQLVSTIITHKEKAILKHPNKRIQIKHLFIIKHEKDICIILTVLSDL